MPKYGVVGSRVEHGVLPRAKHDQPKGVARGMSEAI